MLVNGHVGIFNVLVTVLKCSLKILSSQSFVDMLKPYIEASVFFSFKSLFDLRYNIFFNVVLFSDQLEFMSTFGVPDKELFSLVSYSYWKFLVSLS